MFGLVSVICTRSRSAGPLFVTQYWAIALGVTHPAGVMGDLRPACLQVAASLGVDGPRGYLVGTNRRAGLLPSVGDARAAHKERGNRDSRRDPVAAVHQGTFLGRPGLALPVGRPTHEL
ncbi:hypothetical protein GCM10023317_92930 [Actinopolymorpha pittospori]